MNQNPVEKLRLFALASNGKSLAFDVPVRSDLDLIGESHAILSKHGFTYDELENIILSPTELKEVPPVTVETAHGAVASVDVLQPDSLPPIPKPANKDALMPEKSIEILVSTHGIELSVCVGKDTYIPAVHEFFRGEPPFPASTKVAYKRYWINTGSYTLNGPQHFEQSITTSQGMSKTKSLTMSAELGVAWQGLSAKISATTSTSISITEEKSVTEKYSFDVKSGTTVVYTLWQLVEEFVMMDNAGNPIDWTGQWIFQRRPGSGKLVGPAKFNDNVFTNNSKRYISDPVTFT